MMEQRCRPCNAGPGPLIALAKTDSIIRTRRAVVSSNRWARVVPPDADEPGGQFLDPLAWRDAELSRHPVDGGADAGAGDHVQSFRLRPDHHGGPPVAPVEVHALVDQERQRRARIAATSTSTFAPLPLHAGRSLARRQLHPRCVFGVNHRQGATGTRGRVAVRVCRRIPRGALLQAGHPLRPARIHFTDER